MIERIRGMADVWPAERTFREGLITQLQRGFAAHGYRPIDTPVVESTELFLRKSGEERAAQMYAFDYRNRQIALRPEFTASVVRAFVAEGQGRPLPQRYAYCGPVFRYEKPQSGRSRQFTEAGVELLGARGPAADAEVIHLALASLEGLGLTDCTLRLGHLGVVGALLASLSLDDRVRDWFLWSMEQLRARGDDGLHRNLRDLLSAQQGFGANGAAATAEAGVAAADFPDLDGLSLDGLTEGQARSTVLSLLRGAGVELGGSNRSPEEIVERLLVKLRRPRVDFDIAHALAFLRRLIGLHGEPTTVLADTRALLADYGLDDGPVRELEEVLTLLQAYGHHQRIILDLGLGRGLHYYTGVLFEVHTGEVGGREAVIQLCGGGRYDDLAQILGARAPIPACGFACGVERIAAALVARGALVAEPAADLFVCGAGQVGMADLIAVAERLRRAGWRAELDLRGRRLAANLSYAERAGIPVVVIFGETELAAGEIVWRDLATRVERRYPLDDLPQPNSSDTSAER
ncbi:MAG: Histidyl-tRNA synthetase [uncultured Thermomicrobiales bacterium]|uniref:Histidine--tRNA ligase n=1 Tax=uncultured Thermomicrobiales bacterium TaxID=1645740 RepID=A0A6J4VIW1_9BACT|nr:MAG: Histidyl-tRNA synthetase [uncultured Thermomicrobiales bacterium]